MISRVPTRTPMPSVFWASWLTRPSTVSTRLSTHALVDALRLRPDPLVHLADALADLGVLLAHLLADPALGGAARGDDEQRRRQQNPRSRDMSHPSISFETG